LKNSLKRIRDEKNLTLRQLGSMVGLAYQTVGTYENYDRPLPPDFLRKSGGSLRRF
jgi:transcriptional regulator with XRE-family HTH domain